MITLRDQQGRAIHTAPEEGFNLTVFLREAGDLHAGRGATLAGGDPLPAGFRSLAGGDFGDLATQMRSAGIANALTAEGRLDMRGMDLGGFDLSGAAFRQADLSGARLARSILEEANLRGVRMKNADLSGAWMPKADFTQADMRGIRTSPVELGEDEADLPAALRDRRHALDLRTAYTNAAGSIFSAAIMDGADISQANLAGAEFRLTSIRNAQVRDCDLTDAVFQDTSAVRSDLLRNTMLSNSLRRMDTRDARLRGNEYVELSLFEKIGAALSPSKRHALSENLTDEMRQDMIASLAVSAVARGVAVAAAAHGIPVGLLASVPEQLAGLLHVDEIGKEAIRKACEEVAEAGYAGSETVERAAGWMEGKTGLLVAGNRAAALRRANAALESDMASVTMNNTVFVVSTPENVNALLRKAGIIDSQAKWISDRSRLERAVGGGYPGETAPSAVSVARDGKTTALWRDADGMKLRSVTYGADGTPLEVTNHREGRTYAAAADPDPFFQTRRAVLEDFKDGLVRSLVPHDARTHLAVVRDNGTIVVTCRESGKIDNTDGNPAIRKPDGSIAHVQNGMRVYTRGAVGAIMVNNGQPDLRASAKDRLPVSFAPR